MHIISSAASGGAEVYIKDLSKKMVNEGHDVFIVFLDRANETDRDASYEASFIKELELNGISYGFIGKDCRKNLLKGFYKLFVFRREFSPDIIHSHLYYGAIFSLPQFGVAHVYTHHNIKLKAFSSLYKLLDMRTSCYVGICAACENMLKNVSKRRVIRIDNGVDINRVNRKISYNTDEILRLICVGTLSNQKNHELMFKAVYLNRDLPFIISIVGEGPKEEELKILAKKLGINDKVIFIGNSKEVSKLLNDSDVFIMSSEWEGLPIAQIEATLTGLPVLVTNVGGCAEIVEVACNGLVSEVNIEDYAEKLRKIIIDHDFRYSCFESAIKNSERYIIDNAVISHLSMYKELIG